MICCEERSEKLGGAAHLLVIRPLGWQRIKFGILEERRSFLFVNVCVRWTRNEQKEIEGWDLETIDIMSHINLAPQKSETGNDWWHRLKRRIKKTPFIYFSVQSGPKLDSIVIAHH